MDKTTYVLEEIIKNDLSGDWHGLIHSGKIGGGRVASIDFNRYDNRVSLEVAPPRTKPLSTSEVVEIINQMAKMHPEILSAELSVVAKPLRELINAFYAKTSGIK